MREATPEAQLVRLNWEWILGQPDADAFIRDFIALIKHLKLRHGTMRVDFYSSGPSHLLPLLARELPNIVAQFRFMEYRKDRQKEGIAGGLYAPMEF